MRRLLALVLAGVMAWAAIAAHDQDSTPTALPPAAVDTRPGLGVDAISPAALRQASTQLAALAVKGRAPKAGYARSQFGQRWSDDVEVDLGHNGCDTRNDILRRDLIDRRMKNACKVLAGSLEPDPYTGETIRFQYAGPSAVDIDHVVSVPATNTPP